MEVLEKLYWLFLDTLLYVILYIIFILIILVIIFIVWLLFWYIRSKITLKDTNNYNTAIGSRALQTSNGAD